MQLWGVRTELCCYWPGPLTTPLGVIGICKHGAVVTDGKVQCWLWRDAVESEVRMQSNEI